MLCCVEYASWIELIDTLTNTKISKYLTYILCNLAIVVGVHQLEGFLVLGLLPGELGPGEHPIPVLVVRLKHLVHVLSGAINQSIDDVFISISFGPFWISLVTRIGNWYNC